MKFLSFIGQLVKQSLTKIFLLHVDLETLDICGEGVSKCGVEKLSFSHVEDQRKNSVE